MRVTGTATIRHDTTVKDLKDVLNQVPDNASITVRTTVADRPGESTYSSITFTWDTGDKPDKQSNGWPHPHAGHNIR